MALRSVLWEKPATPFYRPPPLHISVLAMKEEKKVLAWHFESNGKVTPAIVKNNKAAVISDGASITKLTLYEEFSSKITEGQGYIMRGFSLRGQSPPFFVNVTKDTLFFKTAPLKVPEDLRREAHQLLHPVSTLTQLCNCNDAKGMVTVEGEVVELSAIKKIVMGNDAVPLKVITLQQDTSQVSVHLWRHAATFSIQIGAVVNLTHLKGNRSSYGFRLQSTNYTKLEEISTKSDTIVGVLGVTESEESPGFLRLLVESDQIYDIEEALWLPLENHLHTPPLQLKVKISGKQITEVALLTDPEL